MGFLTLLKIQLVQGKNQLLSLKKESKLKILVILFFAAILWGGLYYLFGRAFRYLSNFQEFEVKLIEHIFSLFFFALFVMLTFSNGIIIYSSLFRSEESNDLMGRPISPQSIFLSCFGSAILFSSWAFLFLAAPLMAAFGISHSLPLVFYPIVLVFFAIFLLLPAGLGSLLALLITYYFPRNLKRVIVFIVLLLVLIGAFKAIDLQSYAGTERMMSEKWMEKIFVKISFARHPLYPSYWMAEGILSASSRNYQRSGFLLLFLLANGLFISMLSALIAGKLYRRAYNQVASFGNRKHSGQLTFLDRWGKRSLFFIKPSMRHMIIKDVKTFLRDPVQWSQILIFMGLLSLYILNIRRLDYDIDNPFWKVTITYLNLFAVALTLCTFTSRFIFPQISLEGKRFWILGVCPMSRKSLLIGKFLFSFGGTLIISETIMLLSCWMVEVPWNLAFLNMTLMVIICLGLAGLSVGLGAIYPDFQQENPSKIVSGFGGTLNLILSLLFASVMVVLQALPVFLFYGFHKLTVESYYLWSGVVLGVSLLITLATCYISLKLGHYYFEKMEI